MQAVYNGQQGPHEAVTYGLTCKGHYLRACLSFEVTFRAAGTHATRTPGATLNPRVLRGASATARGVVVHMLRERRAA